MTDEEFDLIMHGGPKPANCNCSHCMLKASTKMYQDIALLWGVFLPIVAAGTLLVLLIVW